MRDSLGRYSVCKRFRVVDGYRELAGRDYVTQVIDYRLEERSFPEFQRFTGSS